MIVVDSSALVAIFEKEPEAAVYAAAIQQADRLLISAVNAHETGIVMRARHGIMALGRMWRFLQSDNDFEIIPFDEAQAREAIAGFERYGKKMNPKGAPESCRLRGLCARQDPECALAVQGRRFHGNGLDAMSLAPPRARARAGCREPNQRAVSACGFRP